MLSSSHAGRHEPGRSLSMRKLITIFVLAVSAALLAGCGGDCGNVPSHAVAKVGDQTITKAQFDQLINQAKKSYAGQKRPFPKPGSTEYNQLKNQAVGYLVQRAEFAQEADDMGIKISDKQIN